jgi:hypothetical protein
MAAKVVIENSVLRGSQQEQFLQRVATVYLDGGDEFRVMAPSKATGDALEWRKQFQVHQPTAHRYNTVTDGRSGSIVQKVEEELERRKLNSEIWRSGTNPDGRYVAAQICLRGHVLNVNGTDFERGEHCPQCGESCIDACPQCKVAIRGGEIYASVSDYQLPYFCHKCGRPYPWMEDRFQTAKELLIHDDKLLLEEREKLWGLLQYVMSDPKSDMAPAKKKLFEIGIAKALPATREIFLDFMAKLGAEMLKPS